MYMFSITNIDLLLFITFFYIYYSEVFNSNWFKKNTSVLEGATIEH